MSRTRPQTPVDPLEAITTSIQQLTAQITILTQQQAAFTQAIQRQDQTIQVGFEVAALPSTKITKNEFET